MANKVTMADKLDDMKDDYGKWAWGKGTQLVETINADPEKHDMGEGVDLTAMAMATNLMVDVINAQPEDKRPRLLVGAATAMAAIIKADPLALGFALSQADQENRKRLMHILRDNLPEELRAMMVKLGEEIEGQLHFVTMPDKDEEPPPTKH